MDHLRVTPARLRAAATEITTAAQEMDTLLSDLDAAAAHLRGEWSGDAQAAFDVAQQHYRGLMTSRADVVRRICTALDDLAVGYSTVDSEAARALGVSA